MTQTNGVRVQRILTVADAAFIPPADPEADVIPGDAEILFEDGVVIVRTAGHRMDGPEFLFEPEQFVAMARFLHGEGMAVPSNGSEPAGLDPTPGRAPAEPGSQDPALLDDPAWLRRQHHDLDRSIADIGRLVGRSANTVRSRLTQHGIEFRSKRGRH